MKIHNLIVKYEKDKKLLEKVYEKALFYPDQRKYFYPKPIKEDYLNYPKDYSIWGIDFRYPLSKSEYLKPICLRLLEILIENNITQVAAGGFGSFNMVGGITALGDNISAALIREKRKPAGFMQIVEGDIDRSKPIWIVDDLLWSGETVKKDLKILKEEGYNPTHLLVLFERLEYGDEKLEGKKKLEQAGLNVISLAVLSETSEYKEYIKKLRKQKKINNSGEN